MRCFLVAASRAFAWGLLSCNQNTNGGVKKMATQQPIIIVDKDMYGDTPISESHLRLIGFMFGIKPRVINVELPRWWFYSPAGMQDMCVEEGMSDEIVREKPN